MQSLIHSMDMSDKILGMIKLYGIQNGTVSFLSRVARSKVVWKMITSFHDMTL